MPAEAEGARRRPGHAEIWLELQRLGRRQDAGEARDSHTALTMIRIEEKLDDLVRSVGHSGLDERGRLIGSGVAGDLARLQQRVENRFSRDDGRMRYLAGAFAAASVFCAALWWIVRTRLEVIFQ